MIDFNTRPYFDDFDDNKKYYRILFRPGIAVQARELTQLQTNLQNQIKSHGDHIFKQGAMVIPGQLSIDTEVQYVKIQPTYQGLPINITAFEGRTITGENGLLAQVLKAVPAENTDPDTLYVRYVTSGDSGITKTFQPNEILSVGSTSIQVQSTAPTGLATSASIERGVYYVNGFFVLVDAQYSIISKYSGTPSARIGLSINESIVTSEDDDTLLDNAQGSYNFAAPGAHRYFIELLLESRDIGSTDDQDFIELIQVQDGIIRRHVTKTDYSELEKTLARRTFDESGNYTVRPFKIDVREHRSNNRGQWVESRQYLIGDVVTNNDVYYVAKNSGTSVNVPPTHTTGTAFDGPGSTGIQWEYDQNPFFNRGIYSPELGGDESKLAIGLEPGKAYVQGYEIEKVATEYVEVNKAREFAQIDNAIIPATVGNYLLVTNVNSLPPIDNYARVTLYNQITGSGGRGTAVGTAVGTARVRAIEWHNGTIGTQDAQYKLMMFDVQMFDTNCSCRTIKSLYFQVGGTPNPQLDFSADIVPLTRRLSGSVTASASTTVTGAGTSFQTDVIVGDYVILGTNLRRVVNVVSQNEIEVDAAVTVAGATVDFVSTDFFEPDNTSLVYRLPYYAIRSVRSALGTNDTSYSVYERFTGTTSSAAGGICTLTLTTSAGTFASAAQNDNYIVLHNDPVAGGSIVQPNSINVVGSTVEIVLPDTYAEDNFVVVAAVNKTGVTLTEKTKSLATRTVEFTTRAEATTSVLLLGKADGFRILSIKMKSGTFASPGSTYSIDISDRYEFDTGQRTTHYDIARLILKPSYSAPTGPVEVVYEYFTHSTGDYFTVNSYPSNVQYSAIPTFGNIPLRDSIDFRPRISDDGSTFSGAGASLSLAPKRGVDVRADFTYYLARKTKIALDGGGSFFAVDGVSSLNPGEPIDPSLGMVLYDLTLEPYTFSTTINSVDVKKIDNRRYTMRDIGRLEKRIDNLEYYTSLSLLEQETDSLDIQDSEGNTRFKNGFIVDGFTGHSTGDATSEDYICSIDMENQELRPFFSMNNINLIEKNSTTAERNASNYKLFGDIITLPVLEEIPLISQPFASRTENVNPFAVFTFIGNVSLNPPSDEWFEVERAPDIINNVEGNFNSLNNLAVSSGALGTVWNAWQTQWTGSSWTAGVSVTGGAGWQTTTVTTATQVGLARTGVRTSIVQRIDREVIDDRVIATAAIPFIRSRNLLVQVSSLKPETRFYPFFDDVDITQYCTPAARIVISGATGEFDTQSNSGGSSTDVARRIAGDTQMCLNKGDVIEGQTSGFTAVVVGTEFNGDTGETAIYVANPIGTPVEDELIVGSISGTTAIHESSNIGSIGETSAGSPLITNFSGDLFFLFFIPNNDSIRYRTGVRELKLVDVPDAAGQFTSRGRTNYRAEGILETKQQTINAVRNAEIVREPLSETTTVIQTSARSSTVTWGDPLAQTILIDQRGGAFLTKVDIFFATKDEKVPVTLEIREVINGYPGKLVLPFSRVTLKPEQVNISNTFVSVDGVDVRNFDTPTTFTFDAPVYVQDQQEYAIVLISDSNNYNVWISQLGDQIPNSARTISEQPYLGVLFKSQNASTWTADQNQDLTFTVYRARFDVNAVANVEFVNDVIPFQRLAIDPFETRTGLSKLRVYHRDHGMPVGSRVVITNSDQTKLIGVVGTGIITSSNTSPTVTGVGTSFTTSIQPGADLYTEAGVLIGRVLTVDSATSITLAANAAVSATSVSFRYNNPLNGIPAAELYTTHIISDVDLDSYCITVGSTATASGYVGGDTVRATRNIQYDAVQPIVQAQTFSDTTVAFGLQTTTGKSVDNPSQVPYIKEAGFDAVLANENNLFFAPRMIASEVNEQNALSGEKSASLSVTMRSTNDALSPVVDTQRTSLILINNKVNSSTESMVNVSGLDDNELLSADTNIVFDDDPDTISSTDSATRAILRTIVVGKYITISGSSNINNNGTFLVTAVDDGDTATTVSLRDASFTAGSGDPITIVQREFFVDDIAPIGSTTYSKYVTRRVNLNNASNFLRVRLAASIPAEASVDVYYKVGDAGSNLVFEDLPYVKLNSDAPVVYAQNGSNRFFDMNFSSGDIAAFDSVQIKIVMKSTNSSAVPRIKDLRVIACA